MLKRGGTDAPATRAAPALREPEVRVYDDRLHRTQVMALWKQVFGYAGAHNAPSLAIDRKLAAGDSLFFVAMVAGAVAGTVMAGYDGHRGWLYSVAVHPSCQKQGVGAALIAHAEAALATRGCVKINLQVIEANQRVTGFYASLGYVIEPRISMGKVIQRNCAGV
ncbi:MAG: GNAT family acetyltransferase [Betaproteobacteria bacterium]